MKVKVTGQRNSENTLIPFVKPVYVKRYGDTLRDIDGTKWAVLDEYGDWVSPGMRDAGIKVNMEVEIE